MKHRRYYSVRTGKRSQLEIQQLRIHIGNLYRLFESRGYFQEAFGIDCVDGFIPGSVGPDVAIYVSVALQKPIWPIDRFIEAYSEADLFDVVEFLYDHVSLPTDGSEHRYGYCGWHYTKFDQKRGQTEFREAANNVLRDYGDGYELSVDGEILFLGVPGAETLLEAKLPAYNPENVEERVQTAVAKFRRGRSSIDERRDAVKSLADVLEFLKPKLKKVLTKKDENDLFQIANRFGIRHHNENQQTDYDQPIWLSWMFYYYLATIHAALRLIEIEVTQLKGQMLN